MSVVTRAVVLGTVVTALVQGTLLGVGFAIAGLPAPVVFGVIGAVLSVVPFGGTALVWVPGAAALFLTGEYGWGLFLVAWGVILVSSADNFLKPLLISGKAEVPTLAVFVGVRIASLNLPRHILAEIPNTFHTGILGNRQSHLGHVARVLGVTRIDDKNEQVSLLDLQRFRWRFHFLAEVEQRWPADADRIRLDAPRDHRTQGCCRRNRGAYGPDLAGPSRGDPLAGGEERFR